MQYILVHFSTLLYTEHFSTRQTFVLYEIYLREKYIVVQSSAVHYMRWWVS